MVLSHLRCGDPSKFADFLRGMRRCCPFWVRRDNRETCLFGERSMARKAHAFCGFPRLNSIRGRPAVAPAAAPVYRRRRQTIPVGECAARKRCAAEGATAPETLRPPDRGGMALWKAVATGRAGAIHRRGKSAA